MVTKYIFFAVFSLILIAPPSSFAQTERPFDVNATVNVRAKLTLSSTTINFPDADPDTVPSIAALENPVSVTSSFRSNVAVNLTLLALTDLRSGSDSIPITNITWTATGSGYRAGTMNRTAPQTAGNWNGSGSRNGTFRYSFANQWGYTKGNYTATVTYTLTAP